MLLNKQLINRLALIIRKYHELCRVNFAGKLELSPMLLGARFVSLLINSNAHIAIDLWFAGLSSKAAR